ncbi:hypothetical protein [Streptomyces sp. NBC_00209]|uniref:hypothetical protein n=1 Tax=Streptomyces sp. NBC_00209 TaxID=2975682 RepID=UPI0032527DCA
MEAGPPDEMKGGWPDYGQPPFEAWLTHRRQTSETNVLAAIPPSRQVRVATYVLAEPGVDPEAAHAYLAQFAETRNWRVHSTLFTERPAASIAPPRDMRRPELTRACGTVRRGVVDSILTTNYQALPPNSTSYEHLLGQLDLWRAFIAFLPPGWLQQPPLLLHPPHPIATPKGTA